MWHVILHIYGPLAIHGYGLMIAIGLLVFIYLIQKDHRYHQLNLEPQFTGILLTGVLAGLLGGRLLFFITNPEPYTSFFDFFLLFKGGLSILGCIIAILCVLPLYLYYQRLAILPLLDLIALYTPLLQSISRIGCFLAGCCYGLPTNVLWGITYTASDSSAPLHVCLHPTQLYSAIGLLIIFALLYFIVQHKVRYHGQIVCYYLLFVGIERFIVDIWRGDRSAIPIFSLNQYIATGMVIGALIGLYIIKKINKK